MSKLLSLSIDVSKITKDKLYQGKKGTYLKLTVSVSDEKDKYGNDVTCWEEQAKEDRGNPKNYLGNGKVFWEGHSQAQQSAQPVEEDDLPF